MRTLMILFSIVIMVSCSDNFDHLTENDLIGHWDIYQFEVEGDLKTYQTVYHNGPKYLLFREKDFFSSTYCIGSWNLLKEKLFLEGYCIGLRNYTILDYQDDILVMESVVKNEGLYQEVGNLFGIETGEEFTLKEYYSRN